MKKEKPSYEITCGRCGELRYSCPARGNGRIERHACSCDYTLITSAARSKRFKHAIKFIFIALILLLIGCAEVWFTQKFVFDEPNPATIECTAIDYRLCDPLPQNKN